MLYRGHMIEIRAQTVGAYSQPCSLGTLGLTCSHGFLLPRPLPTVKRYQAQMTVRKNLYFNFLLKN